MTILLQPYSVSQQLGRGDKPLGVQLKNGMTSRVHRLKGQVKQLTAQELRAFREWFAQFDAEVWDRQFEADAQSGKLDELAAGALRDYEAGRATEL